MTRYNYDVCLVPLKVPNCEQNTFRQNLNKVPYLLYEVEQLSDGRKIVINKPGGKRNFGRLSHNDFMVFVYNPSISELWLISHDEIYEDLENKSKESIEDTILIIEGLSMVCNGHEPSDVLKHLQPHNPCGLSPELIYKVYKWIWGQEDCNYPNQKGRWLSMETILDFQQKLKSC